MSSLLFSIVKEIPKTGEKFGGKKVGKVWRILIKNGTLSVGDSIVITSVNIKGQSKNCFYEAEAVVKSIHEELDAIEGEKEISSASRGSIVGIDLKDVYIGRKKVHKSELKVSKQSIGFPSGESFKQYQELYVRFTNASAAIDAINRINQQIILFWFGKRVAAKISGIPDSLEGVHIRLLSNMAVSIPDRCALKEEIVRSTKLITYHNGKMQYINGTLELSNGDWGMYPEK